MRFEGSLWICRVRLDDLIIYVYISLFLAWRISCFWAAETKLFISVSFKALIKRFFPPKFILINIFWLVQVWRRGRGKTSRWKNGSSRLSGSKFECWNLRRATANKCEKRKGHHQATCVGHGLQCRRWRIKRTISRACGGLWRSPDAKQGYLLCSCWWEIRK